MKFIQNISFFFFTLLIGLMTFVYGFLLFDKINRPTFKNLSYEQFTWYGIVMLLLVSLDIFMIRRRLKYKKKIEK